MRNLVSTNRIIILILLSIYYCWYIDAASASASVDYTKIEACRLPNGVYNKSDSVTYSALEVNWSNDALPYVESFIKKDNILTYSIDILYNENTIPAEIYLYQYNCKTKHSTQIQDYSYATSSMASEHGWSMTRAISSIDYIDSSTIVTNITFADHFNWAGDDALSQKVTLVYDISSKKTSVLDFFKLNGYKKVYPKWSNYVNIVDVTGGKNGKWKVIVVFDLLTNNPPKYTYYVDWKKQTISKNP